MNVTKHDIRDILNLFNITNEVEMFDFLCNGSDENLHNIKIILKVKINNDKNVIVKMVHEEKHLHELIEAQSYFSETLRLHGARTAMRYSSDGAYCVGYRCNNILFYVTVEDWVGEAIKGLDKSIANKIGQMMGKNHLISESQNLHISAPTLFGLFAYNEVSGYNKFIEIYKNDFFEPNIKELAKEIIEKRNRKMNKIKEIWDCLPTYATQGDYSINNMVLDKGIIYLFDFNNAGDEVLLGDAILEGLLIAQEMDLCDGINDGDRHELFQEFMRGYRTVRTFSEIEESIYDDVFAVSRAFWFTEVDYNSDSLVELLEKKDMNAVKEKLYKMINYLAE